MNGPIRYLASVVGFYLLSFVAVSGQTPNCGCVRDFSATVGPSDETLVTYLRALTTNDRAGLLKNSSTFVLDERRHPIYRSTAEQSRILDALLKRNFIAFHFCNYFTSTAELRYPKNRRRFEVSVCLTRTKGDGTNASVIVNLSYYYTRNGWLVDPIALL